MHRTSSSAQSSSLISRWLAVLIFADLLFFPRLTFVASIPFSLFIVMFSISKEKLNQRYVIVLLIFSLLIFASVLFGIITGENINPDDSIKRVLQLITILFYAFYRINLNEIKPAIVKLLRAFYIYVFCFMLIYYVTPEVYEQMIKLIYPEATQGVIYSLENLRFAYILADSNSAGYLICFTLVVYFALERQKLWGTLCAVMATAVVLATMSRGASIALLLIFTHLLFSSHKPTRTKVAVLVFIGLSMGALATIYSDEIELAYMVFDDRMVEEGNVGLGLGGGRLGKYQYWLQNFNLMPFGTGYNLQRDYVEFRPHSDLIRLNLSYGVLALPLLLFFVFPRQKSQVLLFVVFLIPLSINSVMDDYRLLAVYLLMFMLLGQLKTNAPPYHNLQPVRLDRLPTVAGGVR